MTQALGIDIFRIMWQTLALVELDSDKFRCFMFSGLADIASTNEIRRKFTFTNFYRRINEENIDLKRRDKYLPLS